VEQHVLLNDWLDYEILIVAYNINMLTSSYNTVQPTSGETHYNLRVARFRGWACVKHLNNYSAHSRIIFLLIQSFPPEYSTYNFNYFFT